MRYDQHPHNLGTVLVLQSRYTPERALRPSAKAFLRLSASSEIMMTKGDWLARPFPLAVEEGRDEARWSLYHLRERRMAKVERGKSGGTLVS
jgi:hypothetical protein